MRKFLNRLDNHRTLSNLVVLFLAISFFMLLSNLGTVAEGLKTLYSFVATLVAGCTIAYILHPICRIFEYRVLGKMKNRRAARSLGVLCCIISTLAVVALLMWAIVPELISSGALLLDNMDGYISSFSTKLTELQDKIPYIKIDIEEILGDWTAIVDTIAEWITDNVTQIFNYTLNIGSGIFDALVAFFLSIYILLDRRNLVRGAKRFFHAVMREDRFERFKRFAKDSDEILKNYLGGNIIDSFIIGIFNYIYLICVGSPNAGLLAVVNGITNFIPTFGPFIGAIPSAFIILLTEEEGATKMLWFIIFTVVIQQIDGNVLKPILFGGAAGIAPVWVLVSITVFGKMFGLVGMLLGVPIFAILSLVFNNFIDDRFAARNISDIYHPLNDDSEKDSWVRKILDFFAHKGKNIPIVKKVINKKKPPEDDAPEDKGKSDDGKID